MKWSLILLAIGLAASDKLDRTYLPPPGAQFAGGNPGDIQLPLEPPNLQPAGTVPIGGPVNRIPEYGPKGQPTQAPVTTTSYAFTQTTTYPVESYETTALPINPVTGLPIQNIGQPVYQQYGQNLPGYNQNQGQVTPGYNVQPGFVTQNPVTDGPLNYNQPSNQYPNQGIITPGGNIQIPGSVLQQPSRQDLTQYPSGQTDYQVSNQYPSEVVVNPPTTINIPGSVPQITGINQNVQPQRPGPNTFSQTYVIQPTSAPQGNNQGLNQQVQTGSQYNTPQGTTAQPNLAGTYTGQPINVQDTAQPQYNQGYQNQDRQLSGQIPQQQISAGNQNVINPGFEQNNHQQGPAYNTPSSTAVTFPSSTPAYPSVVPINRPERPQAANDRNAVIINYENVRTPNGYSYSYDTSNGIHADETGTVGDGTKAQGSYSYTGDDGKVYSVYYTADENGFRPHGDHIPTAPPIPEAIQKVIEQAARDKAAGIIDDGSYDENKYGDKMYQSPTGHKNLQTKTPTRFKDNQLRKEQNVPKPIVAITGDEEYDVNVPEDGNNKVAVIGKKKVSTGNNQPTNTLIDNTSSENIYGGNINPTNDENGVPFTESNEDNISGITNTGLDGNLPVRGGYRNRGSSKGTVPISGSQSDKIRYTGSTPQIINNDRKPLGENVNQNQFGYNGNQNNGIIRPNIMEADQMLTDLSDGSSITPNKNQGFKQTVKGNRRPGFAGNKYITGQKPLTGEDSNEEAINDFDNSQPFDVTSITNYGQTNNDKATPNEKNVQQIDENGYQYNRPNTQFSQTEFPTRFKATTKAPMSQNMLTKNKVPRPFTTPEVYNQRKENNRPSTTLEPFMTKYRVTRPKDNSYSDYEDGEDYETDDDIDNGTKSSTKAPSRNNEGQRPSRPNLSTQRPYTGQRMHVTQKGTVAPGYTGDYSKSVTPGYTYSTTKSTPHQNSRFGSTEAPKRPLNIQNGQYIGDGTNKSQTPGASYQTSKPTYNYSSTTTVPGYSSTGVQPAFGSRLPSGQRGTTPQNYATSTYRPVSTTVLPTTPGYSGSQAYIPSETPGTYQSPIDQTQGNYQTGYQNGPTGTEYSTTSRPSSTPGYYTQGPVDYSGNTVNPSTRRPGTFTLSGPGGSSQSLPVDSYHNGYHYGPTTPGFAHTVSTTSPDGRPNFSAQPQSTGSYQPGSTGYVSQTTPGYEYGPSGTVFSTTQSPSTIGTTIGPYTPSTTPTYPTQGYSTTQQPIYPSTEGSYNQSPIVDGFGRPIVSQQQPGYSTPGQDSNQYPGSQIVNIPNSGLNNVQGTGPNGQIVTYGNQSPNYPGYYDQQKVIGEDFSGPKQPQRFDPLTGYHY